jgi:hypothetical protein
MSTLKKGCCHFGNTTGKGVQKMEYDINEMYSTWEDITGHAPNDRQKRLIQAAKDAINTAGIDEVIASLEMVLDIKKGGGEAPTI